MTAIIFRRSSAARGIATAVCAAALSFGVEAFAGSWNAPVDGSWNDANNWTGGVPTSGTDANFNLNSTSAYTVTLNAAANCQNLNIFTDKVTFALNGFDLQTRSGPTGGTIWIAPPSGTQAATVTFLGTTGTETVHGNNSGVQIGSGSSSTANVTVDHSILSADSENLFIGSTSTLTVIDGGTAQVTTAAAGDITNAGTLNVNGAAVSSPGGILSYGTMSLTNSATASSTTGNLTFSNPGLPAGNMSADASTIQFGGSILVTGTFTTAATLTLSNAATASGTAGIVVGSSNGNGTVNASGTGTQLSTPATILIGDHGLGTVNLSVGASVSAAQNLYVGDNGGTGNLNATGPATTVTTSGNAGIGTNASNQVGKGNVQLDTGATWAISGSLTMTAGGTLKILSGARATTGSYTQTGGHLNIGLGGASASQSGKLIDNGAAAFAGTLDVTLDNGFTPTANQSFDLMDFASETGVFSKVNLPAVGAGASWDLTQLYATGVIKLTALLPGDANLDGSVNVADLGALSTNYSVTTGMTWAQGDFDNDGAVNVSDLGILATHYGQSVGGGGGAAAPEATVAAVPEPAAGALVFAFVASLAARRRNR